MTSDSTDARARKRGGLSALATNPVLLVLVAAACLFYGAARWINGYADARRADKTVRLAAATAASAAAHNGVTVEQVRAAVAAALQATGDPYRYRTVTSTPVTVSDRSVQVVLGTGRVSVTVGYTDDRHLTGAGTCLTTSAPIPVGVSTVNPAALTATPLPADHGTCAA